ncbi:MAG: cytochrome P450 [Dehalococcoidia bacterium]|nr:cytochrome P450 [Dehalococcoidia bacterium]
MNLNVYGYCMGCGRGFNRGEEEQKPEKKRWYWPFGSKAA